MRTWKIHDSRIYRQISRLGSVQLQTTTGKGQKRDGVRQISSGFPAFCSDARWFHYLLGLIIIGEGGWGWGGTVLQISAPLPPSLELNDNIATSVQTSLRPGLDGRTGPATGLNIL